MILICGIPSESPVEMVTEAAIRLGVEHRVLNQRETAQHRICFQLRNGSLIGELHVNNESIRFSEITGIYTRMMDDSLLPEFRDLAPDSAERTHARNFHQAMLEWLEVTPARVVNRVGPMAANGSKPYQIQLIQRHGFLVPETLITNDPELVREFHARHRRIIYKSASSVRSIVEELEEDDYERLDRIRWCPTQFQQFIPGTNVRVHVVGEEVFPTRIESEATDYRYAGKQGSSATLSAATLDEATTNRCRQLAQASDLPFAGIDLKITPEGEVYCFEVNPSPGFSYFENSTGQPIAEAVVRYLAG